MKKEPITDIIYNGSRAEIGHAAGNEAASADTASPDTAGTAELGDDIYSFQLMFGEDLLKVPMTCDEPNLVSEYSVFGGTTG